MSRPVEQALNTIIPRRSGALPPELIELANSLLAQSRNKCSNLKAEEEIARTYACANLACERLKTTLNLPPIEPSPPIPPRAYKKLYAYFDRTLTASLARKKAVAASKSTPKSTPVSTPKKPITTPSASRHSTPRPLPQRYTPSKDASFSSFRTPKAGLKFFSSKTNDERVPKWVAPCIRQLCRDLESPRAAPHIMAGVESILCLPSQVKSPSTPGTGKEKVGEQTEEARLKSRIPALIAALWFFIVVKLRGKAQQGFETSARKKLARESLSSSRTDPAIVKRIGEAEDSWEGWGDAEGVEEKDVNAWRKEIVGKEWREMDWFLNVIEGAGVNAAGDEDSIEEENDENLDSDLETRGNETRGAHRTGKLVLDKYDYLSEAKQAEYQAWRTSLLAKVNELLAETVDGEGDVDMN